MQTDCFPECIAEWPKGPVSELAMVNPRYSMRKGHEYPFVEMASVGENFAGILQIAARSLEGSGLSRFRAGDTLFAKITPCPQNGKIAFVVSLPGAVGLGSTEFIVLSPRPDTIPRFLFHLACSHAVRGRAAARMEGSTGRQRVPEEVFTKRLLVPLPAPHEQAAIARILDAVDTVLERTRAAVQRARELRRALMQELLPPWIGLRELTGLRKPTGVEEIVRADIVADVCNGSTPSRLEGRYWRQGTIPWLPTGKVHDRIITASNEFVTEAALRECSIRRLPRGTVLVGMIGQGRTRGMSAYLDIEACINQNFGAFTPNHNLLQAIARTNRPLPSMKKRTGVVVDYFGVFTNLEKALNFDESDREESLIDWDALRATVPGEVARCMKHFDGITIVDTRECLLSALRRLRDLEAAKNFEQDFRSLERLWEAIAPDPSLYSHRHEYNWLCGIYVAHRRRQRGSRDTYGELSAKTRQLIQENTTFLDIAESLPVFKIDEDYVSKLDELPTPADKAAALEAILTGELCEDDPSFIYRQLGERLQRVRERQEAGDDATARRLRELEDIAAAVAATRQEPEELNLTQPGEHGLFTILRAHAPAADEAYVAECTRRMVAHLNSNQLLAHGWSSSIGGRMRVEQSLLAESWNPPYAQLGFDPDAEDPPFLKLAVSELATSDGVR